jgi:hypothetical protein
MNTKGFLATIILAATTLTASAATRPRPKTIVVESPANLPLLAQNDADAMYLYETGDGRTLLYIEVQDGRAVNALDVTDPGNIKGISQTEIPAASAFDFVQPVGDQAVLIRYRDGSGIALLNLKHYRQPVLVESGAFDKNNLSETLGQTGLLLASSPEPHQPASRRFAETGEYQVVDTANAAQPLLLAMVSDVRQRLAKNDTGTLFVLNKDRVTVIRRPRMELEHQAELMAQRGN